MTFGFMTMACEFQVHVELGDIGDFKRQLKATFEITLDKVQEEDLRVFIDVNCSSELYDNDALPVTSPDSPVLVLIVNGDQVVIMCSGLYLIRITVLPESDIFVIPSAKPALRP